jgi:hypothetical protein
MSQFLAAAWSLHPDLIPIEVGCVVPEPEEPSVVGQPPLFLRASEIIHDKQNTLQFRAFVKVIEVHDFTPSSDSSSDDASSDDSVGDGCFIQFIAALAKGVSSCWCIVVGRVALAVAPGGVAWSASRSQQSSMLAPRARAGLSSCPCKRKQ